LGCRSAVSPSKRANFAFVPREDREVLIYMNNPLRYAGETFYQAGFDERDERVTILQVCETPVG
jgi:cytochrome c biogenesis protein ResB